MAREGKNWHDPMPAEGVEFNEEESKDGFGDQEPEVVEDEKDDERKRAEADDKPKPRGRPRKAEDKDEKSEDKAE